MFTFRIEGAYDAEKLLEAAWPSKAVTVIQPGAGWEPVSDEHLVVLMSDVTSADMSRTPPTIDQLNAILDFTEDLTDDDYFMVNCWLGQSRSSAVMLAVLIQHNMTPQEALDAVIEQRPIAMPNLLICKFADEIFGLNGELVQIVSDFVSAELRKTSRLAPPTEPSVQAVNAMADLMKLF